MKDLTKQFQEDLEKVLTLTKGLLSGKAIIKIAEKHILEAYKEGYEEGRADEEDAVGAMLIKDR